MTGLLDAGVLYVVATPIGHLGDLTRRGEEVLKQVQIVAAEDTRRTRVLLEHIDHRVPELVSFHEHNEEAMANKLIERLLAGDDVALVSDAGTPLVNDPGFPLVVAAHKAGIKCVPIPGACSITAALSVCPLPCQPFKYIGFLPAKGGARRQFLSQQLSSGDALVFLESPHRIRHTLADLVELSQRRVMLGRELTKQYESILVGSAAEVLERLGDPPKGEFTGIIEAGEESNVDYDHAALMTTLLEHLAPAKAAKVAAQISGAKRADMYALAMSLAQQ